MAGGAAILKFRCRKAGYNQWVAYNPHNLQLMSFDIVLFQHTQDGPCS